MRLLSAALAAVVLGAAGCGDSEAIRGGGVTSGTTLTVYSILPKTAESAEVVDGAKLALYEAGGRAGSFTVNFVSLDEGRAGPAESARQAIKDPQIVAAIGVATDASAEVQVPLFNEAGVLLVSPFTGSDDFLREVRYRPAGQGTFARVVAGDHAAGPMVQQFERIYLEHDASELGLGIANVLERNLPSSLVTNPRRAEAVVYAGSEPEQAVEVLTDLAARAPRARLVVPEALATEIAEHLPRDVRRRTYAPELVGALSPELTARFRQAFQRAPSAHAAAGYAAMRPILSAIKDTDHPNSRAGVIKEFFDSFHGPTELSYRLRPL